MENLIYALPALGFVALLYVAWKSAWVSKQEVGNEKMARIANNISVGAMAFLKAEYKVLSIFVVAVAILLAFKGANEDNSSAMVAVSFIVGAVCSGLAGFLGMRVATKANVRTTNAARTSLGKALEVAFGGGSVMGMGVVGLGVLGLSLLYILYSAMYPGAANTGLVLNVLAGFSLGASFVALYDHPDKYLDPSKGGNPYCQGGAEDTRVYLSDSIHWKITNSTTMTFAAKVSTLRVNEDIIRKHTNTAHPNDFGMFLELREKNQLLI